ncbi:DNA-processing protein DprA [Sphaerisporangium corydalis]|uniref:DNA-processing protein DprA n=1 Tax=Sphaerisporangium corydalis TaxID=1441875 RepID=A0ABV9EJ24_9ACTN|nr:DNA-processing protein DprA [Sphaerisporangium corydalis]
MRITEEQSRLLAICMIKGVSWYFIAREAQRLDGLARLWSGDIIECSPEATKARALINDNASELGRHVKSAIQEAERAADAGARLVTVLDQEYPATLRLIFNPPPFLFVRGELRDADLRSVAVVGTRQASEDGLRRARRMSGLLTEHQVTVVSGLARGIDTAAHTAALDTGGRTIAVVGTGILRCYPAENRALADRIAESGAVVSQFWPDANGATYTFPRRNVTMSGIAQGTVVIEAASTSGAKMQARLALEHGKRVFLLRSLTEAQPWAQEYVKTRGALMVEDVDDVVKSLSSPDRIQEVNASRAQLTLEFEDMKLGESAPEALW